VLLIVMDESGTWRARPGQILTFGRGAECTIRLPAADRGVSRAAGHLAFDDGAWWLRNDSSSSVLYVSGDRGFRVDLPPGMRAPVQQWHAKIRPWTLLDPQAPPPPPLTTTVPDLIGLSVALAQERVQAAQLHLTAHGSGNWVGNQSPAGGTVVPVGSSVSVGLVANPP